MTLLLFGLVTFSRTLAFSADFRDSPRCSVVLAGAQSVNVKEDTALSSLEEECLQGEYSEALKEFSAISPEANAAAFNARVKILAEKFTSDTGWMDWLQGVLKKKKFGRGTFNQQVTSQMSDATQTVLQLLDLKNGTPQKSFCRAEEGATPVDPQAAQKILSCYGAKSPEELREFAPECRNFRARLAGEWLRARYTLLEWEADCVNTGKCTARPERKIPDPERATLFAQRVVKHLDQNLTGIFTNRLDYKNKDQDILLAKVAKFSEQMNCLHQGESAEIAAAARQNVSHSATVPPADQPSMSPSPRPRTTPAGSGRS